MPQDDVFEILCMRH